MLKRQNEPVLQQIRHNCYIARSRAGEQFVPEHVFSYQIAGSVVLNDGTTTYTVNQGESDQVWKAAAA